MQNPFAEFQREGFLSWAPKTWKILRKRLQKLYYYYSHETARFGIVYFLIKIDAKPLMNAFGTYTKLVWK